MTRHWTRIDRDEIAPRPAAPTVAQVLSGTANTSASTAAGMPRFDKSGPEASRSPGVLNSYYTAAHEGTFGGDNSTYYSFNPPVPAYNHIELGLSRSKHATYTFNPNWYPVIWPEIMSLTYFTIDSLYFGSAIDYWTYPSFLYLADEAFFACLVEHFSEQGGTYAQTRIDVGEPSQPINGSGFIPDTQSGINQKLTVSLWGE